MAKAANLPLDVVTIASSTAAHDDYRQLNRTGKIPTFVGSDGYVLTESIAIAVYGRDSPPPEAFLTGWLAQ